MATIMERFKQTLFLLPQEALNKIWLKLAKWLHIISWLKMLTTTEAWIYIKFTYDAPAQMS